MKLYRKAIADFIWDCIFTIAALRERRTTPPAKPYRQDEAITTTLGKLKGAKR